MSEANQQDAGDDSSDRGTGSVELALRMPDGRPWPLTFTRGIERFIGAYPRLPGFNPGGARLAFRTV